MLVKASELLCTIFDSSRAGQLGELGAQWMSQL